MCTGMTIKAFLATDDDGDTYIYLIDDPKWLQKDEDGDWDVCDYEGNWEMANIRDEYDMSETFGFLSDAITAELDRVHIPSKGEGPVEIDINLSLSWY